jgi:hypothetical protein
MLGWGYGDHIPTIAPISSPCLTLSKAHQVTTFPKSSQAVVDTSQLIQSGGIVCLSSFVRMRISWDHHKPTSTSTSTTRARFDSSSPEPFPYNTAGSQRPIHAFEAAPNLFGASFHPPVPFPPRRNASLFLSSNGVKGPLLAHQHDKTWEMFTRCMPNDLLSHLCHPSPTPPQAVKRRYINNSTQKKHSKAGKD